MKITRNDLKILIKEQIRQLVLEETGFSQQSNLSINLDQLENNLKSSYQQLDPSVFYDKKNDIWKKPIYLGGKDPKSGSFQVNPSTKDLNDIQSQLDAGNIDRNHLVDMIVTDVSKRHERLEHLKNFIGETNDFPSAIRGPRYKDFDNLWSEMRQLQWDLGEQRGGGWIYDLIGKKGPASDDDLAHWLWSVKHKW